MTKVYNTELTEPDELLCHYPGENNIQPTNLELDLEDGELTAGYNPNVGGRAYPESVGNRRTLWFPIPCLTATAANALLEDAKPIAQRILDGATIEWNGNNLVGVLTSDAQAACDELAALCDEGNFSEADYAVQYDAGDWFAGEGSSEVVAERLRITAATTDEQIAAMTRAEEEDARDSASIYGYLLLAGTGEYLTGVRDELREAAEDEGEDPVEQPDAFDRAVDDRRNVRLADLRGTGPDERG